MIKEIVSILNSLDLPLVADFGYNREREGIYVNEFFNSRATKDNRESKIQILVSLAEENDGYLKVKEIVEIIVKELEKHPWISNINSKYVGSIQGKSNYSINLLATGGN